MRQHAGWIADTDCPQPVTHAGSLIQRQVRDNAL
jgi:hypothetical protein